MANTSNNVRKHTAVDKGLIDLLSLLVSSNYWLIYPLNSAELGAYFASIAAEHGERAGKKCRLLLL